MTDRDRAWDAEHHRVALQIIAESDRGAHLDHGPLLSDRKAAHDALIAAVDAERAERGQ